MLKELALFSTVVCYLMSHSCALFAQALSSPASPYLRPCSHSQTGLSQLVEGEDASALADDFAEYEKYSDGVTTDVCGSCCGTNTRWGFWLPSDFYVDGWIAQGYTANADDPPDGQNGPIGFNDRADEYQLNQLYLILGKKVQTNPCTWDIGGRVDVLYGTDYYFTTATGLETRQDGSPKWNSSNGPRGAGGALYGLAMPQAYAELSAPIGNGLNIKMGHFYSILGYESVMAPENFFYSHSYSRLYAEPFTHVGMLFTYEVSPRLAMYGGLTRGWDTWEEPNDTLGGLVGFEWFSADDCGSIAFALHTGNEKPGRNRTAYSLVCKRQVTNRMGYVFQHDLGVEEDGAAVGIRRKNAVWYSIAQYLSYELTDSTSMGLRVEWFRDEDAKRVFTAAMANQVLGKDFGEVSLGLNWKPTRGITIRPEARWDFADVQVPLLGIGGMYNGFRAKDQFTAAVDLILRY